MVTKPSILLVEDDAMIALMVADICEALGYGDPVQADGVAVALDVLGGESSFAAALLDVHLGLEAVWPVADALAARGVPFAFMTGGGGEVPAAHAMRPTLAKPFRVAELDSLLQSLLSR